MPYRLSSAECQLFTDGSMSKDGALASIERPERMTAFHLCGSANSLLSGHNRYLDKATRRGEYTKTPRPTNGRLAKRAKGERAPRQNRRDGRRVSLQKPIDPLRRAVLPRETNNTRNSCQLE